MRISDAERERVIAVLRGHCADGRLTLDEFAERAGVVYAAKVQADLEHVLADLPTASLPATTAGKTSAPTTTTVIGIMSGGERKGHWRPGEHVNVVAFWGGCHVDLRGAQINTPVVEIDAIAIMGGIDIIVPEGIKVELTAIPIMGGANSKVKDVPILEGTPVIKVRAVAFWGGVSVRSKPSLEAERRLKEQRKLERQQRRLTEGRRDDRGELLDDVHDRIAERIDDMTDRVQDAVERATDRAERHHRARPVPPARPAPPAPPARPASGRAPSADDLQRELDARIAKHEERHRRRLAGLDPDEADLVPAVLDGSMESVADAVNAERPDLSHDAMPDGTVTILFTDIEDSTTMIEELGDIKAQDVIRAHNEIVRAQVAACGGHEVKSQGDSFMVSFAGARRGLRCAVGIQRAFEQYCEKHPEQPVRVRIGLHTGEAIREAHDLFGKSVIMAARIAAQAEGQEILVSSLLKELTDSSGEFVFGKALTIPLKGLSGKHTLYRVEWRENDLPSALSTP